MIGSIDPIYLILLGFAIMIIVIGGMGFLMFKLKDSNDGILRELATIRRNTTGSLVALPINPLNPQRMSKIEQYTHELRKLDVDKEPGKAARLSSWLAHEAGKLQDEIEDTGELTKQIPKIKYDPQTGAKVLEGTSFDPRWISGVEREYTGL